MRLKLFYKILVICVVVIVWIIPNRSYSQYYEAQISQIVDEMGESPSATFSIIEDAKGFIWFGTVDGLYRYDGYNFKIFRNQKDNKNSLSNNTIRAMWLDSNQILWIGTQGGGLNTLDLATETFTHYKHTGKIDNEISGNSVWSVIGDENKNIWIGVSGFYVDKFNQTTQEFTHYKIIEEDNKHLYEPLVRSLIEDSDGNIWIGTANHGLIELNTESNVMTKYIHDFNDDSSLSNSAVFDIYEDLERNLWICTFEGGLNLFNRDTKKFNHIKHNVHDANSLVSNLTYNISENNNGTLLISTDNGLCLFDYQKNNFTVYKHNESIQNSISDNRVTTTFVDKQGTIWVGTESGVDKIIEQNMFKVFKNIANDPNSISKGIVRSIYEDIDGYLWVGFLDNGIVRYDKNTNLFKPYKFDFPLEEGVAGNRIVSIYEDSNDDLWIGEWYLGLLKYNKSSDTFIRYANSFTGNPLLSDNRIKFIREMKPGYLIIGSEGGVNILDLKKDNVWSLTHNPSIKNSLNSNAVQSNACIVDSSGSIWVGMWSSGFNKIEFEEGDFSKPKYSSWKNIIDYENSLSNNNVISMCMTSNNIIWIGTFGGGLNRFDIEKNEFKRYTLDEGLPNNIIFSILEDESGNLWLSTDKGISEFNPITEVFQNYDYTHGLQGNHFFWGASHKNNNGELFFGGTKGLNSFIPDSVATISNNTNPTLLDIKIFNEKIKYDSSIPYVKSINLLHDQNKLAFEFSGLDFIEPKKNIYRYYLKGVDKNYNIQTNHRNVEYTNLQPGSYAFYLNVSKDYKNWSSDELVFNIHIKPPWWKTWWARLGFLATVIGSLLGFYYARIGLLKKQKQNLENQVIERTQEITEKNQILEENTEQIIAQKNELAAKNSQLSETLNKLKTTQEALIEAEKMASLGIMTAGLAHEINNPLNFIAVGIENIKSQIDELNKDNEYIDTEKYEDINRLISHSESGIERINNIVKSLRIFSHKDDDYSLININEIVENAIQVLKPKIPKYIKLEKLLNELPEVSCKHNQILQVLNNILENALSAIEEKSEKSDETIWIETRISEEKNKSFIEVLIKNSGSTINDEDIKHLFDPFYTTKSPNKGTGLGLYIAYNIISEHKGQLFAQNLDKKVIFKILLPL